MIPRKVRHVMVAGDWHGDGSWAERVIWRAKKQLPAEEIPVILQLGDFGVWPGRDGFKYLRHVQHVLEDAGALLMFIDGNHEDFGQIEEWHGGFPHFPAHPPGKDRIWHLPRGYRWQWGGRTWLAAGGAASVDRREITGYMHGVPWIRAGRIEGTSWWPGEQLTGGQAAAIIADGKADVMVCHDFPSGVTHAHSPFLASCHPLDIADAEEHSRRMQSIVDAVQPGHYLHGHLHRCYTRTCDFGYGPVEVTGLHMNGKTGNYAVLDVEEMAWGEIEPA